MSRTRISATRLASGAWPIEAGERRHEDQEGKERHQRRERHVARHRPAVVGVEMAEGIGDDDPGPPQEARFRRRHSRVSASAACRPVLRDSHRADPRIGLGVARVPPCTTSAPRQWFRPRGRRSEPPGMASAMATPRSILITGCSSGIGYAAAHALKSRGWRVFATCRKQADCDRLAGEGLETVQLDYADADSVAAAVDYVLAATGGSLDALYNNGSYAHPAPSRTSPATTCAGRWRRTSSAGGTSPTACSRPCADRNAGRIVNCSSVLGFVSTPFTGAYNATKYAVEAWSDALRIELRDTGIRVSIIEPGPIRTQLRRDFAAAGASTGSTSRRRPSATSTGTTLARPGGRPAPLALRARAGSGRRRARPCAGKPEPAQPLPRHPARAGHRLAEAPPADAADGLDPAQGALTLPSRSGRSSCRPRRTASCR